MSGIVMMYIDPGTGSIILQVLLGSFFVGLVTIRFYWQKFKGLFSRKSETSDDVGTGSME